MDKRIIKLTELIESKYDNGDPGHDVGHIMRVVESCKKIGAQMNANLEVLIPAALLHDIVNLPKNHPERKQASQRAAEEGAGILRKCDYTEDEINQISLVITEHSFSLGKKPTCVESSVLQDCDRLDALGAIGVMRAVSCGSRLGANYYDLKDPFAEKRELDDKKFTIDHFFTKLLKLNDTFNTQAARDEAKKRISFMKNFLDQMKTEIKSFNLG